MDPHIGISTKTSKPTPQTHFMDGFSYDNDTQLVQEIYRRSDESSRLTKSKAARVEFLTNVRYIEKYLTPGAKILDVGAGTGVYSLYFSRRGYEVSALELADSNIQAFRESLTAEDAIDLAQGNALDLSRYPENSFDIVLLFGPCIICTAKATSFGVSRKQNGFANPAASCFWPLFPTIW